MAWGCIGSTTVRSWSLLLCVLLLRVLPVRTMQVSCSCLGLGAPDVTTRRDVMSPWLCTATCCGEKVDLSDDLLSVPCCVDSGPVAPSTKSRHPQAVQLISTGRSQHVSTSGRSCVQPAYRILYLLSSRNA